MGANHITSLRGVISDLDELAIKGSRPTDITEVARWLERIVDAMVMADKNATRKPMQTIRGGVNV